MTYADQIKLLARLCEWDDTIYLRLTPTIVPDPQIRVITESDRLLVDKYSSERGYRLIEIDRSRR